MATENPSASELLADFLARSQADFDAFCAEHPGREEELRGLRDELAQLADVKDKAITSVTVTEEIRRQFGPEANPGVQLEDDERAVEYREEVHARLGGRSAFGRYQIKGEIGRGGQGAVIRVWDEDLRRSLAMKVLLGKEASPLLPRRVDSKKLGRFLEEAQVTGQLDHPGIVPVHELGLEPRGGLYFTMKLVKGENLRAIFRRVRDHDVEWGLTRAISVMLKVCEAVSYAHSKGVVHRDLKPANIMVGRFGEVYVMDWGLARVLGEEERRDIRIRPGAHSLSGVDTERQEKLSEDPDSPLVTMEGDVVGTPAFMAPEQARGELDRVGPLADVYSIGAMLYELLSGQAPYVSPGARLNNYAIWGMVQNGPPAPIERLARDMPAELIAICQKAMQREPDKRYGSVGELRTDLQAFIGGRVVQAYDTGPIEELKKWVLRNRALAAACAVAGAFLVVAIVFITNRSGLADKLELSGQEIIDRRYVGSLRAAAWGLEREAYREARASLDACPPGRRRWEWKHVALRLDQTERRWQAHQSAVTGLAFDAAGERLVSVSTDGFAYAWNPADGSRIQELDRPAPGSSGRPVPLLSLASSSAGVLTATGGGALHRWGSGGDLQLSLPVPGARTVHTSVPGAGTVLTAGVPVRERERQVPSLALVGTDELIWEQEVEGGRPLVAVAPDAELALVGVRDGVEVWYVATGKVANTHELLAEPTAFAFDPAGELAVVGCEDGALVELDLEPSSTFRPSEVARTVPLDADASIECLAFSPDGQLLVVGLSSGRLTLVGSRTLRPERDLFGHASRVRTIAFDPSGERFASGDEAGEVLLWPGDGASYVGEFDRLREGILTRVQVSADGSRVVASGGGVVRVWNGEDAQPLRRLEADAVAFDAASNRVLLASGGRRTLVGGGTEQPRELAGPSSGSGAGADESSAPATLAALAPGGERAAFVLADGSIELQDIGGEPRRLEGEPLTDARHLRFSPSGKRLVAAGPHQLLAFDVDTGAALPGIRLTADGASASGLAWDPLGRYVVYRTFGIAGERQDTTAEVSVLDLESGETSTLVAPQAVYGRDLVTDPTVFAFDPRGDRLVCCFSDGLLRMWDRESWEASEMRGPADEWRALAFDDAGERLFAWSAASHAVGVFDLVGERWLLNLPIEGPQLTTLTYDDVHERLLATTDDGKRIVFIEGSAEHARTLWHGVAAREKLDRLLETQLQNVLSEPARAEIDRSTAFSDAEKERLGKRLDWIGQPTAEELNTAAWEIVGPDARAGGDAGFALRMALAAVELEPNKAHHHDTLGWAWFATGDSDRAQREIRKAMDLALTREERLYYGDSLRRLSERMGVR